MGDAVYNFIFIYLKPSSGSKAMLIARCWDALLRGDNLASFSNTGTLIGRQKVVTVSRWNANLNQMKHWTILCAFFLGGISIHPDTYDMEVMIDEAYSVGPRIHTQSQRYPYFPASPLHLICMEYNESFCQGLERRWRVWWTNFERF